MSHLKAKKIIHNCVHCSAPIYFILSNMQPSDTLKSFFMRIHVNMNHCFTHWPPRMFIMYGVSTKIYYTFHIFLVVLHTQPISFLFISSP